MSTEKRQAINAEELEFAKRFDVQERTIIERIPPVFKKDLIALQKHETKILESLNKDEELAKLFLSNPGAALAKINIPVPQAMKKQLKPDQTLAQLLQPRQFRLANGQVVTPKVRIRFTGKRRVR